MRYRRPARPRSGWQLRSNVVFKAKNADGAKVFRVRVDGKTHELVATVEGCVLVVRNRTQRHSERPYINERLTESDMARAVKGELGPFFLAVAERLCTSHEVHSGSSPFISGYATNTFAGDGHDGCKLHIELSSRKAFINPWSSGDEPEFFLIGTVWSTDCRVIEYHGRGRESISEVVGLPGSGFLRSA
jgi:hypothetical protein